MIRKSLLAAAAWAVTGFVPLLSLAQVVKSPDLVLSGTKEAPQEERAKSPAPANDRDWVDPFTGHRIVRLSDQPNSSTLYFHDNAFSSDGDKFMFNTPGGIAVYDVAKIGTPEGKLDIVAPGSRGGYFARRTREIYTTSSGGGRGAGRGGATTQPQQAAAPATQPGRRGGRGGGGGTTIAVNVDTKQTREVPNVRGIINADETLTLSKNGNAVDPDGTHPKPTTRESRPQLSRMFPGKKMEDLTPDQQYSVTKEDGLARRALNPALQSFTFTDLKTGQSREVGYQYGDLNHMQFNPVDPNLLLYCYEGTWHELDRTWTIRSDGSQMKLMHKRSMDMEINGHEWWSFDGKTVWFDLQMPRSEDFWLASVDMATMKETRYHITRDTWGVHFNSSRDNTLFVSDGGDPSQVSYSTNGMWMNLFRVQPTGGLKHERLLDMSKHSYVTGKGGVEPNAHITPDKKWVIFTGQFEQGQRHVYAVEIEKSK